MGEAAEAISEILGFIDEVTMPNKSAAANRRYAGQLDDFMKFDCQDCIWESSSAAVTQLSTVEWAGAMETAMLSLWTSRPM